MTTLRQVVHEHNPAQLRVETVTNSPPQHSVGRRVLVGTSPTGGFSGYAGHIAWSNGTSWQFDQPRPGWRVYVESLQEDFVFHLGKWQPSVLIREKCDLIAGGNNGVPERLPSPSADFGYHHFLTVYQEEAQSPKQFYYVMLFPGHMRLVSEQRLLGSPNAGKHAQEIELGQGLAFQANRLVCTVTGGADPYYYFAVFANQPAVTAPGLQLTNATPRFIDFSKHGILNDKGSYKVTVNLLLHGDHKFIDTGLRYAFSIARRYEFNVYVEDVPTSGDLPYFDDIKTTYHSGKWIRYNSSNIVVAQGSLREMDITGNLSIVSTYLRLNLQNNLLSNLEFPAFDFPLYGKYSVKVEAFSSSMTTSVFDHKG